jgi:hypothetical protein
MIHAANKISHVHDRVLVVLGVYSNGNSHFIIEILPNLLYLLEVLGKNFTATVLYRPRSIVNQMMDHLSSIGLLNNIRLVPMGAGSTHFAHEAYFADLYPGSCLTDSQKFAGPEFTGRVRRMLASPPVPNAKRKFIRLIYRKDSRAISNWDATVEGLRSVTTAPFVFQTYRFSDYKSSGFRGIIEAFKTSAIIIGVHGAGLANILFAPKCTTVIELMWRDNYLNTPTAFNSAAIALDHDYWMVLGDGKYSGTVPVDILKLQKILKQVQSEKLEAGIEQLNEYCRKPGNMGRNRSYIDENMEMRSKTRCAARPTKFD